MTNYLESIETAKEVQIKRRQNRKSSLHRQPHRKKHKWSKIWIHLKIRPWQVKQQREYSHIQGAKARWAFSLGRESTNQGVEDSRPPLYIRQARLCPVALLHFKSVFFSEIYQSTVMYGQSHMTLSEGDAEERSEKGLENHKLPSVTWELRPKSHLKPSHKFASQIPGELWYSGTKIICERVLLWRCEWAVGNPPSTDPSRRSKMNWYPQYADLLWAHPQDEGNCA